MNYKSRKRARNFFYKMIAVGSFGFLGSFIYVLFIVKMSDMEAVGYSCEYSMSGIVIRLVVGMCLMGLSFGVGLTGLRFRIGGLSSIGGIVLSKIFMEKGVLYGKA